EFARAFAEAFAAPARRAPPPAEPVTVDTRPERELPPPLPPPPTPAARPPAAAPPTPAAAALAAGSHPPLASRPTSMAAVAEGAVDLASGGGRARVRVSLVPTPDGRFSVHVRGLDCFVRPRGGRATSAVQLESTGVVEL